MCEMGGQWFLYSPQPYDKTLFCRGNVHHRVAGVPSRLRAAQLGQLFFPVWAKCDAVDVFWSPRHQLPLLLSARIPSVVTINDLVWLRYGETMRFPGRQIETFLMPRSMKQAQAVIAISEFTREEIERQYPHLSEKLRVVTCASHLPAEIETSAEGARAYFLFVGTMEPRKNLPRLIRAYKRYVENCPAPKELKIVGGQGWGEVGVAQLIQSLSLGRYARVIGKVGERALGQLYADAHALVMPSLYEGFGLPVAESLSQGVPVITSRDSAMEEVAGEAAILVDPFSEQSIYEGLMEMTVNTELHSALSKRASEEIQRYDWDVSARKMFKILNECSRTE
jgi:glycosyltransferase involved in cell wall biosynthesis